MLVQNFISSSESRTIFFSRQYFSITFLLSLYNNELPLYYLLSHFILALPSGFFILRLLSSLFFVASLGVSLLIFRDLFYKAESENPDYPAYRYVSAMIWMIFSFKLFCLYLYQASPKNFSLFLIVCGILFFTRTYIKGDSSKSNLFITFAVLSLYTTKIAFYCYILFAACVLFRNFLPNKKTLIPETSKYLKRDLLRVFMFFIPGLCFWLFGHLKQAGNVMNVFSFYDKTPIYYFYKSIQDLYAYKSFFAGVFLVTIILLFFYHRKPKTFFETWVLYFYLVVFCFLTIYSSVCINSDMDRFSADADMNSALSYSKSCSEKNDGYLFLSCYYQSCRYSYKNFLRDKNRNGLIIPDDEFEVGGINLGPKFPSFGKEHINRSTIGSVKELFLQSRRVWVFYYCDTDKKCDPNHYSAYLRKMKAPDVTQKAFEWISKTNTTKKEKKQRSYKYFSKTFSLKSGFSRDGILLDLFVNDYGDKDRAAELIQDETFKPEMLRSYFWNDAQGRAEEAAAALVNVCGEDGACRKTALNKIDLFSKSVAEQKLSEPLRRFIEEQSDKWK